jgi:hypothetical protein
MAVFIKKAPVTSSYFNETIKRDSILFKLGTDVDLTIIFVTAYSILNFLLIWQQVDISKLPKITILYQNCDATSQWIQVESKDFQR